MAYIPRTSPVRDTREAEESNTKQKIERVEQQFKEKLGEKEVEVSQATAELQANLAKREAVGKTVAAQAEEHSTSRGASK